MYRRSGKPYYIALVETKSMKYTKGSWTIYKMRMRCQQKCTTCMICQNVIPSQDIAYMHVLNIHATVLWHVMHSIYWTCFHAYSPEKQKRQRWSANVARTSEQSVFNKIHTMHV